MGMGLTKKQKRYLAILTERNKAFKYPQRPELPHEDPQFAEKQDQYEKELSIYYKQVRKGLTYPLSPAEKMMRLRLKKKAFTLAEELCMIYSAYVMPSHDLQKEKGFETAAGMVNQIEWARAFREVFAQKSNEDVVTNIKQSAVSMP
jgi:hypothetical protein